MSADVAEVLAGVLALVRERDKLREDHESEVARCESLGREVLELREERDAGRAECRMLRAQTEQATRQLLAVVKERDTLTTERNLLRKVVEDRNALLTARVIEVVRTVAASSADEATKLALIQDLVTATPEFRESAIARALIVTSK